MYCCAVVYLLPLKLFTINASLIPEALMKIYAVSITVKKFISKCIINFLW